MNKNCSLSLVLSLPTREYVEKRAEKERRSMSNVIECILLDLIEGKIK